MPDQRQRIELSWLATPLRQQIRVSEVGERRRARYPREPGHLLVELLVQDLLERLGRYRAGREQPLSEQRRGLARLRSGARLGADDPTRLEQRPDPQIGGIRTRFHR